MRRIWWIVVLVAAGVGLAIAIGLVGTRNEPSKTEAVSTLCSSLSGLETSIENLTKLPRSASKTDYQNAVTAVQDAWDQVKSDAQAVQNAPTGDLDNAWTSFTSAVKDVPNDASVEDAVKDITQAADQLASAAKSTISAVSCSAQSTTTTSP